MARNKELDPFGALKNNKLVHMPFSGPYPEGTPMLSFPGPPLDRDNKPLMSQEEFAANYVYRDGEYVPRETYSPPLDTLGEVYSRYDDPEGMSYADPETERFEASRALEMIDRDIARQRGRRKRNIHYQQSQPSDARELERDLRAERDLLTENIQNIEDDAYYSAMEVKQDPMIREYGLDVDQDGRMPPGSYGEASELAEADVAAARRAPAKSSVVRPDKPEDVLAASRETGEPWQDMLVNAYISRNPWLDQHKVRKAVYNVANKHYDKWKQSLEARRGGSYMDSLYRDLRRDRAAKESAQRSRTRGGGGGRRGRSNYKSKADKSLAFSLLNDNAELQRYYDMIKQAEQQGQQIFNQDMRDFNEKSRSSTDAKVGDFTDLKKAQQQAMKKRHAVEDEAINTLMRSMDIIPSDLDEKQRKALEQGQLRYNRSTAQKSMLSVFENDLKKSYLRGDRDVVDFVDRFKTGKKAGNKTFTKAANELYFDLGLSDPRLTRGRRGFKRSDFPAGDD